MLVARRSKDRGRRSDVIALVARPRATHRPAELARRRPEHARWPPPARPVTYAAARTHAVATARCPRSSGSAVRPSFRQARHRRRRTARTLLPKVSLAGSPEATGAGAGGASEVERFGPLGANTAHLAPWASGLGLREKA